MAAHAAGERQSLAKSSGRRKVGRECWHLQSPGTRNYSSFVQSSSLANRKFRDAMKLHGRV